MEKEVTRSIKLGAKVIGTIIKETGKPIAKYAWEEFWRNYRRRKFGPGRRIG